VDYAPCVANPPYVIFTLDATTMLTQGVNLDQEGYDNCVSVIKASNLSGPMQYELIDLLDTVLEQTKQAESMGWL